MAKTFKEQLIEKRSADLKGRELNNEDSTETVLEAMKRHANENAQPNQGRGEGQPNLQAILKKHAAKNERSSEHDHGGRRLNAEEGHHDQYTHSSTNLQQVISDHKYIIEHDRPQEAEAVGNHQFFQDQA